MSIYLQISLHYRDGTIVPGSGDPLVGTPVHIGLNGSLSVGLEWGMGGQG